MKILTELITLLHFITHNSVVIDTTQGLIQFHTWQWKPRMMSGKQDPTTIHQLVLIHDSITVPPLTAKTITAIVDHLSEWQTRGTLTPEGIFTESVSLLISHSMSTIIDKKSAVRITNTTEWPYSIKKYTQIAEISVVTSEQSKFIKPLDTPILSMIPESNPDLTIYLNKLLRTKKQTNSTEEHLMVSATHKLWPNWGSYLS